MISIVSKAITDVSTSVDQLLEISALVNKLVIILSVVKDGEVTNVELFFRVIVSMDVENNNEDAVIDVKDNAVGDVKVIELTSEISVVPKEFGVRVVVEVGIDE